MRCARAAGVALGMALAGCGGAALPAAPPPTPTPRDLPSAVSGAVGSGVGAGRWVGVVVGVYDRGRRDVFAFGAVDAGAAAPDGATIFEIGSITKTFTAAVLAAAVREGLVRLDEPLRDLLPREQAVPSYAGQDFTLEQVAVHSSGLPRLPDDLEKVAGYDAGNPYASYDQRALYSFLARYRLPRAPGARYEYSNLAYGLLGHALALRLGVSWEEALRARVVAPLGLEDTWPALDATRIARLAPGHDDKGRRVPSWTSGALDGAYVLRSTAGDLLAYAAAALGHAPSPLREDLAAAIAPRYAPQGLGYQVGLAWMTRTTGTGVRLVEHDGGTGGYASYLGVLPDRDAAVVVLANSAAEVDTAGRSVVDWVAAH